MGVRDPRTDITRVAAFVAIGMAVCGWRTPRQGHDVARAGADRRWPGAAVPDDLRPLQPAVMVVKEPLLGPTSAFAGMVLVTAAGLAVAVRLEAIAMAFFAVLGGFATPVLVGSGADARDLLFAYLLLLDLGYIVYCRCFRSIAPDIITAVF